MRPVLEHSLNSRLVSMTGLHVLMCASTLGLVDNLQRYLSRKTSGGSRPNVVLPPLALPLLGPKVRQG